MPSDEQPKPFGAEFLEEMLQHDSDVYGATRICANTGPTYVNGVIVDSPPPPHCVPD